MDAERRKVIKGLLAAGGVAVVGGKIAAPEVRRELRDRNSTAELEESIKTRIDAISRDFGVHVNTDVKDLQVWSYGFKFKEKYKEMDSRSILDDYFVLLEGVLWTFPPDTLSTFVETINVAKSIGGSAGGRAPILAYQSEPRHRHISLGIDKYLTGIFAIGHSMDRGIWASVNRQYRDVVYHEIVHRLTTQKLLTDWPQGEHVSAYGRNEGPIEDISTFAEAVFEPRKSAVDPNKMTILRAHISEILKLPGDYWSMIGSGPHAIEKWHSYWKDHERLRNK